MYFRCRISYFVRCLAYIRVHIEIQYSALIARPTISFFITSTSTRSRIYSPVSVTQDLKMPTASDRSFRPLMTLSFAGEWLLTSALGFGGREMQTMRFISCIAHSANAAAVTLLGISSFFLKDTRAKFGDQHKFRFSVAVDFFIDVISYFSAVRVLARFRWSRSQRF